MPSIEKVSQSTNISRLASVSNKTGDENANGHQGRKVSRKELKEIIKEKIQDLNDIVDFLGRGIRFKLHDETDLLMTQIIDVKTQEVLKEMPPEEMLDLIARIEEMVGLIIDEKV